MAFYHPDIFQSYFMRGVVYLSREFHGGSSVSGTDFLYSRESMEGGSDCE